MATHARFEVDLKADPKRVPNGPSAGPSELQAPAHRADAKSPLPWSPVARAVPRATNVVEATADLRQHRALRRTITREQGCALETIGHAVDYLNDCYLQEGTETEILDFSGPTMEAVQILISTQRQILRSLPLTETLSVRLRHALLRRKSQLKRAIVVPLTSSR